MNQLPEKTIECPYCGEAIDVLIDTSDVDEQYIEDCQVCCKPINFLVSYDIDDELVVNVYGEDEAY
ncbi:CPXCG motif-containing cysteine-rich protein [Pseudoalteromonas sp. SWXJZ94C]|uniref:CPXCG motif-containing cysteine-rich protein n=1 Tax=unclassified Pseudoalteromonas TaxID=194690 RepID=UPI00040BF2BB|nr:CPXCG motif-containing cysteine-rich protein [Pseudoalteromonas sp. TB64]MBH0058485.1 CPXCG motif-containing cysteine-rich protein [Pseudoalteromonas sp. SWXJZ94C]